MQLNGLSLHNGVRVMLVKKDNHAVDMVFPITGAYTDRATRFQNEANMTDAHCV